MVIDRDTPVNSIYMRIIDGQLISQSVLPTQKACAVKMAAIIEAGASFSNREEWNWTLENFKSSHQVEFSVLCSKSIAAANRRLSPKVVQHPYDHKYARAQYGYIYSGNRKLGLFKIVYDHSIHQVAYGISNHCWQGHPVNKTQSLTADRVTLSIRHQPGTW